MKKTKLAPKHLRKLAEIYFTKNTSAFGYYGICCDLEQKFGEQNGEYCWFTQMEQLLIETGYAHSLFFRTEEGKCQLGDIKQWQSRAWMCLFLAEYLETKDK